MFSFRNVRGTAKPSQDLCVAEWKENFMLRTRFVRYAGRLLGAVTLAGALSAGLLTATPASAATHRLHSSQGAKGITLVVHTHGANGIHTHLLDANGV